MPMHRNFEGLSLRVCLSAAATLLLVAACGKTDTSSSSATAPVGIAPVSVSTPSATVSSPTSEAPAPVGQAQPFSGRTGQLVNPDAGAMVFLYYDLAGLAPPIANWVEDDSRVISASAFDKESRRTAVKAELESGAAAVRGIGLVRLTMNANLSEYDRTYGEYMVRALAPSSVLSFDAFGQKISLMFGNGRTAQLWRIPEAEAKAVRDKIGYGGSVSLDALLKITGVQPSAGGGTIVADVVEYEMQVSQSGLTLGRVQVTQK